MHEVVFYGVTHEGVHPASIGCRQDQRGRDVESGRL